MKKQKFTEAVTVQCVVGPTGDVIDPEAIAPESQEAAASAVMAVSQYRFKPATLDGLPVATLIRVVVNFRIF